MIEFKDTDFIKVITGVRRSGKSVLLMQYRDYLLNSGVREENVVYINLESYENQFIKDEKKLGNLIVELIPKNNQKFYLLVDEIQYVEG